MLQSAVHADPVFLSWADGMVAVANKALIASDLAETPNLFRLVPAPAAAPPCKYYLQLPTKLGDAPSYCGSLGDKPGSPIDCGQGNATAQVYQLGQRQQLLAANGTMHLAMGSNNFVVLKAGGGDTGNAGALIRAINSTTGGQHQPVRGPFVCAGSPAMRRPLAVQASFEALSCAADADMPAGGKPGAEVALVSNIGAVDAAVTAYSVALQPDQDGLSGVFHLSRGQQPCAATTCRRKLWPVAPARRPPSFRTP
jgi:hypothetical protein